MARKGSGKKDLNTYLPKYLNKEYAFWDFQTLVLFKFNIVVYNIENNCRLDHFIPII